MKRHERLKNHLLEAAGWYGAGAIVLAYLLSSFGFLSVSNLWYHILNATGAIGFIFETVHRKDYQPTVVNVLWLLVATFSIVKLIAEMK